MGRFPKYLSLSLLCCAAAGLVSAQSISITFLNDWGEQTSRVLEEGKAFLRVVDPGANISPDRDRVTVDLSATISEDMATTDLVETGAATGIFEGEVALTTDWVNNTQRDPEYLLNWPREYPPVSLDTATATYGSASASAEAAPSLVDLLDDGGRSAASFALGERVRVRVRDLYADRQAGPNTTVAILSSSSGESETLTLTETGDRTGVFETSIPLVSGAPVSGDGRLQSATGETLSVTHADANGFSSSSDSAGVTATSVRFINWRDGSLPALYVENGYVAVRVVDRAANVDPGSFDTADVILYRSVDQEPLTLRETGVDTGVFEGRMRLRISGFGYGNGYLEPNYLTEPPVTVTVGVAYQGGPIVTAKAVQSILSLRDGQGAAAGSIAPGQTLHLRVEAANGLESSELERVRVRVQSLTSGDEETLYLLETGSYSWLFDGTLQAVAGAAVPNDGQVQALPGEVLQVDHFDVYNILCASAQVKVVRSAVRFVDESGRTVSSLLEGDTARVEVLDQISAGQTPPFALIRSYLGWDDENLTLVESATPGIFEDEMSLTTDWSQDGDGLLYTSYGTTPRYHPDQVIAQANGASAVALTASAVLEILDEQGEPRTTATAGVLLRARLRAPKMNQSATQAEALFGVATSGAAGDFEYVNLVETGPDTAVFEATLPTRIYESWPSGDGVLTVRPADTVTVYYDPPNNWYPSEHDRAVASLAFVPVLLELVDGQGRGVSTYLFSEPVHLRVTEAAANTSPGSAESISVQVQAWRQGDSGTDLETVSLTETGPDTGVFTGTLPSSVLSYPTPQLGNGLLEVMGLHPVYRDDTTVTAFRGDAADTAVFKDSELWLTQDAGQEAESFPLGLPIRVWLRRPVANTSPDIEIEGVSIRVRTGGEDQEWLTLEETGGGTGLFTDLLPTGEGTVNAWNNVLEGSAGDIVEVVRTSSYMAGSWDRGVLTATPPNSPPDAVDDSATTAEDTAVSISVLGNDSDLDDDTLTVTAVTQGAQGSVTIDGGSTVTYTPNPDANGIDAFTYTVDDGQGGSDTATVTVTIQAVNDPPSASGDSATTPEDTAVSIAVLGNDADPDSDTLTLTAVTQSTAGTVTTDGTLVTFTPPANQSGVYVFTYTVRDPAGLTDTDSVTVTVTAVNDTPVAQPDAATTPEDTAVSIAVLGNDSDPDNGTLTVTAVTQSTAGTVTTDGTLVTFTPPANQSGAYVFTYTVRDPAGLTDTDSVTVTVTAVNDAPVAQPDAATTNEDTAVTVAVLGNDSDLDNDSLTVTAVTQSTAGTVTTDGTLVTFTPPANQSGTWVFTYTVRDPAGLTDTDSVTVTVTAVNDAPAAQPDAAATNEDTAVVISVLTNDSDVDGNPLTVTAVTQGTWGAVTTSGTSVTYTPAANLFGADSFTYTVSDGQGGTATATVSVSVAAVNDPPAAGADSGATRERVAILIPVLANDTDPEGNPLTVTAVGDPHNGATLRLADNTVRYTPDMNFTGSETFTYTVSDGQGGTGTGQITVTVGEALEQVALLATNSVALRLGADVLSGDVIVNQAGAGPFLNGASISVGHSVTTPSFYDLEGDSITVASTATVYSHVWYNQLTNDGIISAVRTTPLALPVFSALPPFLAATPGSTNVSVSSNGTRTLAAGSYQDLTVGKKGTVTFTGGVYHFRTLQLGSEAKLYFTAPTEIRVQQKLTTKELAVIGPAAGATIDASSIVFHVAGINGTSGGLAATPKVVEIGITSSLRANVYAPNGTIWLQDRTQATGAFLGKDIDVGADVQVSLDSAFAGGQ